MATEHSLVARADALAARIHAGQTDKGGHPYIEHPRRVARAVEAEGEEAVIAALLHDVVEDGGLSVDELRAAGMPETSIAAIVAVTKQADEHGSDEGYRRFIERIATSGSRLAIVVKLADLADNADLTRLGRAPTPRDEARAAKYAAARTLAQYAVLSKFWRR